MGVIRDRWRTYQRQQLLAELALQPQDLPAALATDAELAAAVATAIAGAPVQAVAGLTGSPTAAQLETAGLLRSSTASATYATIVEHGSTASTPRPAGALRVFWRGTVTPSNAAVGDRVVNISTPSAPTESIVTAVGPVTLASLGGGGTGGSGVTLTDNGDGTFTVAGSGVADNGDGTFTIAA